MFLKQLNISTDNKVIREIKFRKGINLIVDESKEQITGNNVGKTTVLKLIDFSLGADSRQIYIDPETKKDEYKIVKDFLIENKVLITLVLTEDLDSSTANKIVIERNFLPRKENIRRVNGDDLTIDEFEIRLSELIFPDHHAEKPTFRQIISHNIRYKDENINNTLKTLDKYTTDAEYETLYLFLLGCEFSNGKSRQEILSKIQQENNFKKRLEKQQTKTAYETALSLVDDEIEHLNKNKSNLNLNKDFELDLDKLNNIKYKINKVSSEVSKLNIRKNLIIEAGQELNNSKAEIDLQQLQLIYQQATSQIQGIQKTFNELVEYHNQMTNEKIKFITKDLPNLEKTINTREKELRGLLSDESELSAVIAKSDSYEELEKLISQLNEQFRKKGEYENIIQQLEEVEGNIRNYNHDLGTIDEELFSDKFEQTVKSQLTKFNRHFSSISNRLYGEQYLLKYDIITNRNGQRLYKFSAFNANMSSGK
ncbi:DUF2326 domain-containing protein, partial [Patescibacteria group bacterium]|nr:DUF2326 domain-containing protein [Patescibacteria group bacterium]